MSEVINAIKERRSIRKFKEEQISQEQLQQIIDCALLAPSARNAQPWHFTVVQNGKLIDEFNAKSLRFLADKMGRDLPEDYHIFYHAPTVIFISYNMSEPWGMTDSGILTQTIALAAQGLGLGSIILGMFRGYVESEDYDSSFDAKFKVPEGHRILLAVSIGNADVSPNAPPRKENYSIVK